MAFELDYGFAVLFFWLVESKVFNDGFRCWGCNFAPFGSHVLVGALILVY